MKQKGKETPAKHIKKGKSLGQPRNVPSNPAPSPNKVKQEEKQDYQRSPTQIKIMNNIIKNWTWPLG